MSAAARLPWRIALAGAALALLLIAALAVGHAWPGLLSGLLDRVLARIGAMGGVGAVLFALLQIAIAASGVLPASVLGVAAGAVYGAPLGFAISGGATLAGAWVAFRLARSLFRPRIERMLASRPRLRNLDQRLGQENWRLVCLLRVSPVMPFAITSYTLGLSSVSPRAYMAGSLAAMPALLGYVVLGSLAHAGLHAGETGAGPMRWVFLGVGIVATILLTARVGQLLERSLRVGALSES